MHGAHAALGSIARHGNIAATKVGSVASRTKAMAGRSGVALPLGSAGGGGAAESVEEGRDGLSAEAASSGGEGSNFDPDDYPAEFSEIKSQDGCASCN